MNKYGFSTIAGRIAIIAALLLMTVSAFAQSSGGGGGNFPGNPLPQTPPAPDILIRDSFGWGPQGLRPNGNGQLLNTLQVAWLSDFWVEYPGSNNTRWIAPTQNNTWNFCGTDPDPFQLFSPLEIVNGTFENGCLVNSSNGLGTAPATALMTLPGGLKREFEVGIDGFAALGTDNYLAIGLTNSNQTAGNFFAFGAAVLVIRNTQPDSLNEIAFELHSGNMFGPLLAHGTTAGNGFYNQIAIRYNPRTKTLGARVNGVNIESQPVNFSTPKYGGFEGAGVVDNFVVKAL